jgi:hypothetical protein
MQNEATLSTSHANGKEELQARITGSFQAVHARISAACAAANRPRESVRLLAVSKTVGPDAIAAAYALGQRSFGENYVQEALSKMPDLLAHAIDWHHIGPLQSNKTATVAQHFAWVQGVDRLKLAERLSAQRPAHLPALNVCVQVNVSGEDTKSGCAIAECLTLCEAIARLPRLHLRGLMALPAAAASLAEARAPFAELRRLFERVQASGLPVDTLSMGMSDDLEAAIAEGSTLVRVGSSLFGRRLAQQQISAVAIE